MAMIVSVERKSAVLKRPTLPCLSRWHTINLLAGCPYECRYCYARSFRSNPGDGKVLFYANTLELLRHELPRKRVRPEVVYFSTACEPFAPEEPVLETLYGVMQLLLEYGVTILISTKSKIPQQFLNLFASYARQVFVQVGLTTLDDSIRAVFEPNAGTVDERIQSLESLCARGIPAEARMDPLIPELTDHNAAFAQLCRRIAACGASSATASYLFLRQAVIAKMRVNMPTWSFHEVAERLYTHTLKEYCGHNAIRIPDVAYRREKYAAFKDIAASHGVQLRLCQCKNSDLTDECCHPPLGRVEASQLTLDLE